MKRLVKLIFLPWFLVFPFLAESSFTIKVWDSVEELRQWRFAGTESISSNPTGDGFIVINPGNDPQITSPSLSIPIDQIGSISFTGANFGANTELRFYLSFDGKRYNETNAVSRNFPNDGKWHTIAINIQDVSGWNTANKLTGLRIDPVKNGVPVNGNDNVFISRIKIKGEEVKVDINQVRMISGIILHPSETVRVSSGPDDKNLKVEFTIKNYNQSSITLDDVGCAVLHKNGNHLFDILSEKNVVIGANKTFKYSKQAYITKVGDYKVIARYKYKGEWRDIPTDSGSVNPKSFKVVSGGKPNLQPYQPPGWDNEIVVSPKVGDHSAGAIYAGKPAYFDYAFINNSNVDITTSFTVKLYIDGKVVHTKTVDSLSAHSWGYYEDFKTTLPAGEHKIDMVVDASSNVDENNENDNTYRMTINIEKPTLSIAELIRELKGDVTWVTVDDKKYGIVKLKRHIDPATLSTSTDGVKILYVDANWNPISSYNLAKKIELIRRAREYSSTGAMFSHEAIEGLIYGVKELKSSYRLAEISELMQKLTAKTLVGSIKTWLTGGSVSIGEIITEDLINGAQDFVESSLRDPQILLKALGYTSLEVAQNKFEKAEEILAGQPIKDYQTALSFLQYAHNGLAEYNASVYLFDAIYDMSKTTLGYFKEVGVKIFKEVAGIFSKIKKWIRRSKVTSDYAEYIDKIASLIEVKKYSELLKERGFDESSLSRSCAVIYTISLSHRSQEKLPTYTLRTLAIGKGNISPAGGSYNYSTQITLKAIPSEGWKFESWGGDIRSCSNPITITVDDDKVITAYFSRLQKELPDRILVKDPDGKIFWVQNGKRYHVLNTGILSKMRGVPSWSRQFTFPLSIINKYQEGPKFISLSADSDGLLIRQRGDRAIYLMENGKRRLITTEGLFLYKLKFDWDDVIIISEEILNMVPEGDEILPEISAAPSSGAISESFVITLRYFQPNSGIKLFVKDPGNVEKVLKVLTADDKGSASYKFLPPSEGVYTFWGVYELDPSTTTRKVQIEVNPPTGVIKPMADFIASQTSGYAPLVVQFTDRSSGNPTSWNWDFGDGSTSTHQNPSHVYTVPGIYTVTLIVSSSAGSDVETKVDYINVKTPINDTNLTNLINSINEYLKNSPMKGEGEHFVKWGRYFNVDPRFVVAIAGAESSFGKNPCGNQYNAWGWKPEGICWSGFEPGWDPDTNQNAYSDAPGFTPSKGIYMETGYEDGIFWITRNLRREYLDKGLNTVEEIGEKWCPEDTANWIENVKQFLTKLKGNPNDLSFTKATNKTKLEPGAVSIPPDFNIKLPFEGEAEVTAGYSPFNGSNKHANINNPSKANDYYALDFGLIKGTPVLAIADGIIVYAGWTSGGWSGYGKIVIIDHENGFYSNYAHLDEIKVALGQRVKQGQIIGLSGCSSNKELSNTPIGPHLHFALYKDVKLRGDGVHSEGGPYGGVSALPEPFSGYYGIKEGDILASDNRISTITTAPIIWDSVEELERWNFVGIENISSNSAGDGFIIMNPGNDPQIISLPLLISIDQIGFISFTGVNFGANTELRFYLSFDGRKYNETNAVSRNFSNDGKWHTITINIQDVPGWNTASKLTGLRIDPVKNGIPVNGNDNVFISRIEISRKTQSKPNLQPYQPSGWDNEIIASPKLGDHHSGVVYAGEPIYFDYAFINNSDVDITTSFTVKLYIDGTVVHTKVVNGLSAHSWGSHEDFQTTLTAGQHRIMLKVDEPSAVVESKEDDNSYEMLITVSMRKPTADFTASPTSGIAPLTVQFTDRSSGNPTGWSWNFGDGVTSTQQNPSHTYSSSGTYTVTLTVSNSSGSDTKTKANYIQVQSPPTLSVSPSSLDFGTQDTTKTLTISNSGGGDLSWSITVSKQWILVSPLNGLNNATVSVTVNRSGLSPSSYSGSLSITSNGGNKNVIVSMTVQAPALSIPALLSPNDGDYVGAQSAVTLSWNSVDNATSYRVVVSTNSDCSNPFFDQTVSETQVTVSTLNISTTYYWRVKASNQSGESDWSNIWSFITEEPPPPNEPDILVSSTTIDFGNIAEGNSKSEKLRIENRGSADLQINNITSNNSAFSISSADRSFTLTSGSSRDVTVIFSPTGVGDYSAELTIQSNDPDQPSLNIQLIGQAVSQTKAKMFMKTDAQPTAGGEFWVDVKVEDVRNLFGASFVLNYDAALLSISKDERGKYLVVQGDFLGSDVI